MSPGWTAFTIRCIAGSSVGAPAPFRARMAGRAVSLRKALALPSRSHRAAACASCASATASATRPMLRETTGLPDNPTPLLRNQPPDPLMAIVSGAAGTWHPGHALYCLCRWARRQGVVSDVEILPRRPAADGGHPGTDGRNPH